MSDMLQLVGGVLKQNATDRQAKAYRTITVRCLPMIEPKKTSEFLETSLIYMLSAVVAALGFLLVCLICMLAGFGRT